MNGKHTLYEDTPSTFNSTDTTVSSTTIDYSGFDEVRVTVISGSAGVLYLELQTPGGSQFLDIISKATTPATEAGAIVANTHLAYVISAVPATGTMRAKFVCDGAGTVGASFILRIHAIARN